MTQPDVLAREITPASEVTLHGKVYQLAFPMKAVILYKQKTGDNLFDPKKWKELSDPEKLTAAFWAAASIHQPELSYDAVTLLLDFSNLPAAEAAIVECLQSYMPKPKPVEGDDPNAPAPSESS
jgi:hypothetical protein